MKGEWKYQPLPSDLIGRLGESGDQWEEECGRVAAEAWRMTMSRPVAQWLWHRPDMFYSLCPLQSQAGPPPSNTQTRRPGRGKTEKINSAYNSLRGCLPNVPGDTKLTKIKTLRLATSYIDYLISILQANERHPEGFQPKMFFNSSVRGKNCKEWKLRGEDELKLRIAETDLWRYLHKQIVKIKWIFLLPNVNI